jgi:hypothetical protein
VVLVLLAKQQQQKIISLYRSGLAIIARLNHSILRSYIKQQHGKNENKNTGLFINCMDFVVVRIKKNKKKNRHAWALQSSYGRRGSYNLPYKMSKKVPFGRTLGAF